MYISPNINLSLVASAANLALVQADVTATLAAVPLAEQRKLIAGGPGIVTLPDGVIGAWAYNGFANGYGAWAEVSAATATALLCLNLSATRTQVGGNSTYGQIQIGVGAGGSEVVQTTLPIHWNESTGTLESGIIIPLDLPLPIAIGSRIAVRSRTNWNTSREGWGVYLSLVNPANVQKWSA